MYDDQEPHFWALVGNLASPSWADAAIAFVSFYHLFFKGLDIETCVNSMKVASGDHQFSFHLGAAMKASWQAYIQHNRQRIATSVEQAADETSRKGKAMATS